MMDRLKWMVMETRLLSQPVPIKRATACISSQMSENVLGGSAITVNLNSGASLKLVAEDTRIT